MTYEVILFDVDDTLFDFGQSERAAFGQTFHAFNLSTRLETYRTDYKEISSGLWAQLEQGELTLAELGVERYRRLFQKHALDIDADRFNQTYLGYLGKEAQLMPGAVELCDGLTGVRLAVVTNGFEDVQQSRIKQSPLHNTFEKIITSEAAASQKPQKAIFDYTFSALQLTNKENVLIVGDSLTSDIQGGVNYGIDTCWFNPEKKANTSGVKPTYEIHALTDLLALLEKNKGLKGCV